MQGALSAQYMLETELEWLIYQLWSKNTARAPTFSFNLAETIILRQGCPQTWYFSSREGYILRKNSSNVRLNKINKRFIQKNGLSLNCQDNMPVAQTYLYRPQRNLDTGAERMSIRTGYIAGKDFHKNLRLWGVIADNRPQIVQMFIKPRLVKNHIIKVHWSPTSVQMTRIINKTALFEQKHPLAARTVTFEDDEDSMYTDQAIMQNTGLVFDRILRSLLEIYQHIKKSADIALLSGTFYFKAEELEKPVLLFAAQLKTDRPILVLNPKIQVALIVHEMHQLQGVSNLINDLSHRELQNLDMPLRKNEKDEDEESKQQALPPLSQRKAVFTDSESKLKQNINGDQMATIVETQSVFGSKSGSLSATKNLSPDCGQNQPKRPYSGFNQIEVCSFCSEIRGKINLPFQLTVNQIIKLYDYYTENPAGLLLVPPTSPKQQKFYEEIYQQVTMRAGHESGAISAASSIQSLKESCWVPLPIMRAFGIVSPANYELAKLDPAFTYKTINLCITCYESVKVLIINQSKEQQNQQRLSKDQLSQSRPSELSSGFNFTSEKDGSRMTEQYVMRQGWMKHTRSENIACDRVVESEAGAYDPLESSDRVGSGIERNSYEIIQKDKTRVEPEIQSAFAMFSKVQAGKEISSNFNANKASEENYRFESDNDKSEHKAKSDLPTSFRQSYKRDNHNNGVVSLNIKSSQKDEVSATKKRALSLKFKRDSKKIDAKDKLAGDAKHKQILDFVRRIGGVELKPSSNKLKSSGAFQKIKTWSTKSGQSVGGVATSSNFPFHEKKKLRDARRNLRRQKEQMQVVQAVIQQQQRQLVERPTDAQTEKAGMTIVSPNPLTNDCQSTDGSNQIQSFQPEKEIIMKQFAHPELKVAPKDILTGKIRPISAYTNLQQAVNEIVLKEPPVDSTFNQGAKAFPATGNMVSYPSNPALLSSNHLLEPQEIAPGVLRNPNKYTNLDACKVYLKSITKSDIQDLYTKQQKSRQKHQKLACQRLSGAGQKNSGSLFPQKQRQKSIPKLIDPYQWKRPLMYPTSKNPPSQSPNKRQSIGKAIKKEIAQNLTHGSINMFNYQSNASSQGQQTNLIVPQNIQRVRSRATDNIGLTLDKNEDCSDNQMMPKNALTAASLLSSGQIESLKMTDIEQIAANADNLIQILQSIKQASIKSQSIEQHNQPDPFLPSQLPVPDLIHTKSDLKNVATIDRAPSQPQAQEWKEKSQSESLNNTNEDDIDQKQEDFWDSHTHSPPMQQKKSQQNFISSQDEKDDDDDLWGDNYVQPEMNPNQEEIQASPIAGDPSQTSKLTSSQVVTNKSLSESQNAFRSQTDLARGGQQEEGGDKGSLIQDAPMTETEMQTIQVQTDRAVGFMQVQQSVEKQSQNTLQDSRVEAYIHDSIPKPLLPPQNSGIRKMQTEKKIQQPAIRQANESEGHSAAMVTSKVSGNEFSDNMIEHADQIVQQSIEADLKNSIDDDKPLTSSAMSNGVNDILQSDAFNSMVIQNQKDDDINLSHMDVPQLSPVKQQNDQNVRAQVYTVVDNRFLESSPESSHSDDDLAAAPDDSYTQDFSSFQRVRGIAEPAADVSSKVNAQEEEPQASIELTYDETFEEPTLIEHPIGQKNEAHSHQQKESSTSKNDVPLQGDFEHNFDSAAKALPHASAVSNEFQCYEDADEEIPEYQSSEQPMYSQNFNSMSLRSGCLVDISAVESVLQNM